MGERPKEYITGEPGTSKLVKVRDAIFIAKRGEGKLKNSPYVLAISNKLREKFFADVNHKKIDGKYQIKMSDEKLWKEWESIWDKEFERQYIDYVATRTGC